MTRQRFETLDAMRGVAAIAVVCLHLNVLIEPLRVGHGYLAVDFFFAFFALSGLVLAQAYGARFEAGLGVGRFLRMRLIRLYPLYILGTLVGIAAMLWPMYRGYTHRVDAGPLALALGTSLLMLPGPPLATDPPSLTPFNPPAWSLVFELAANVLLAACWRLLTPRVLASLLIGSAVLLAAQCLAHGDMNMGPHWTNAALGIDRTLFSFVAGICIARSVAGRRSRPSALAWLPLPVLGMVLLPGAGAGPFYDLACVLFVLPALLFWGASVEPVRSAPFRFLGTISFAIYAIHVPMIYAIELVLFHVAPRLWNSHPLMGLVAVPALVVLAWLADLFYDRPVRAWLQRRLGARPSAAL